MLHREQLNHIDHGPKTVNAFIIVTAEGYQYFSKSAAQYRAARLAGNTIIGHPGLVAGDTCAKPAHATRTPGIAKRDGTNRHWVRAVHTKHRGVDIGV